MLTRCPAHGRPLRDASLCAACVTELEKSLADLGAYCDELVTMLTRQDRVPRPMVVLPTEEMLARARGRVVVHPGPHGTCTEGADDFAAGRPHAHVHLAEWQRFLAGLSVDERADIADSTRGITVRVQPLPFDDTASRVLLATHNALVGWVRTIVTASDRWPRNIDAAMCRWLLKRVPAIRVHDEGQDLLASVADMAEVAKRTIDLRPDLWFAGVCGAPVPDGRCEERLYAEMSAGTIECDACGAVHDVGERRADLLAAAEDQLETATHLARALTRLGEPVTPERIRKWRERGRLVEHGVDLDGHPTYRVGDVIDLLEQDRERAERRAS